MLRYSLVESVSGYISGKLSIDEMEDAFQSLSGSMLGETPSFRKACISIHNAFAELRYGLIQNDEFKTALAVAIRPLESDYSLISNASQSLTEADLPSAAE